MKSMSRMQLATRGGGVAALCAALTMGACGLDKDKIPDLGGPSELSISIKLSASPDVLTADGFSTALVQVQVFDQNGQTVAGRAVLLALSDASRQFADLGTSTRPREASCARPKPPSSPEGTAWRPPSTRRRPAPTSRPTAG